MTTSASSRRHGRAPLGSRIFGGGALVVGVLAFLVALSDLREGRDAEFSPVNAAFMPLVVTGMWVLFAGIYFVKQLINPTADYPAAETETEPPKPPNAPQLPSESETDDHGDDEPSAEETEADRVDADPADVRWLAPVLLVAVLVAYVLEREFLGLGFMITSPPFFFAVTMIFGSRKYVRDAIVAAVLSWGIYVLFTQVLEVTLPQGVWPW